MTGDPLGPARGAGTDGENVKIKQMLSEARNDYDFSAIIECEHCRATYEFATDYHDNYFHTQVLPGLFCALCRKNRAGEIEGRA